MKHPAFRALCNIPWGDREQRAKQRDSGRADMLIVASYALCWNRSRFCCQLRALLHLKQENQCLSLFLEVSRRGGSSVLLLISGTPQSYPGSTSDESSSALRPAACWCFANQSFSGSAMTEVLRRLSDILLLIAHRKLNWLLQLWSLPARSQSEYALHYKVRILFVIVRCTSWKRFSLVNMTGGLSHLMMTFDLFCFTVVQYIINDQLSAVKWDVEQKIGLCANYFKKCLLFAMRLSWVRWDL